MMAPATKESSVHRQSLFRTLVIAQRSCCKQNRVFPGDSSNHFRRIEEPITIVLPVGNIVREVPAIAVADRKDGNNMGSLKPVRPLRNSLRHVADGNHIDGRDSLS